MYGHVAMATILELYKQRGLTAAPVFLNLTGNVMEHDRQRWVLQNQYHSLGRYLLCILSRWCCSKSGVQPPPPHKIGRTSTPPIFSLPISFAFQLPEIGVLRRVAQARQARGAHRAAAEQAQFLRRPRRLRRGQRGLHQNTRRNLLLQVRCAHSHPGFLCRPCRDFGPSLARLGEDINTCKA